MSGSPFCEHKKLRTSCGHCKPATLAVDTSLQAVPFLSEDERERLAAKREKRTTGSSSSRGARERDAASDAPGAPGVPSHTDVAPKIVRGTGPGKPLLPQRKRANRSISAAEADAVKPWWVKKEGR